jgi:hypothetical protein
MSPGTTQGRPAPAAVGVALPSALSFGPTGVRHRASASGGEGGRWPPGSARAMAVLWMGKGA